MMHATLGAIPINKSTLIKCPSLYVYNNFLVNAKGGSNSFLLILILPRNMQQERWLYNSSYIATVEVTKYMKWNKRIWKESLFKAILKGVQGDSAHSLAPMFSFFQWPSHLTLHCMTCFIASSNSPVMRYLLCTLSLPVHIQRSNYPTVHTRKSSSK